MASWVSLALSAFAIAISGGSLWVAVAAHRRAHWQDKLVFNVDIQPSEHAGWLVMELKVSNKTKATWTVRDAAFPEYRNAGFVSAPMIRTLYDRWTPAAEVPRLGRFAIDHEVASEADYLVHVYFTLGSNSGQSRISAMMAALRSPAIGQPSGVQPMIGRRCRLALTIWSRNHSRSFRWERKMLTAEMQMAKADTTTDT